MGAKKQAPSKSLKGGGGSGANKITSTNATRSAPRNLKAQQPQQQNFPQTETEENGDEIKRQQTLLNIFSTTFQDVLGAENFASQLQELKTALFNRDFEGAFARETALDVYAARWSPTRALCYGRILRGLDAHLKQLIGDGITHPRHSLDSDLDASKRTDEYKSRAGLIGGQDKSNATSNTGLQEPNEVGEQRGGEEGEGEEKTRTFKILAIGGAAAEIVAFADYLSSSNVDFVGARADITMLDVGPWGSVVQRLYASLTTAPPISRYASAAAREANRALVATSQFHSDFLQKDILSLGQDELAELLHGVSSSSSATNSYSQLMHTESELESHPTKRELTPGNINSKGKKKDEENDKQQNPLLITLLFTLNELYTAGGIKRTTSFLRSLTAVVPPGSLLLVVDSPGSYSEAAVGKEAKRYPMQWLLDHTLVPPPVKKKPKGAQEDGRTDDGDRYEARDEEAQERGDREGEITRRWEKLESCDSVWFRIADGLRYPIALENMRYQLHLYRASTV
ncbi:hypothetical protein F5Y19DRAFT_66999 [Xylariaceae sp. FL1651]|nr:hypothetical protein F5Y19DRAFT_66999 [Xylariaceae sp. FL1651]